MTFTPDRNFFTTPDINFLCDRLQWRLPKLALCQCLHGLAREVALAASAVTCIASLAGYGALLLNRDIPAALMLGASGTASYAINSKLRGEES